MQRHNSNMWRWVESKMMTCGKWWNMQGHVLVWSSSSRAIGPLSLLPQRSVTNIAFCRWVVTDIESVSACVCSGVSAEESETPVNDINFSATSKTALIFKYVLAGTVHFDVGLVVHTMQRNRSQWGQWENNWNRHTDRHMHILYSLCYTWIGTESQLHLFSHCCIQKACFHVNRLFPVLGTCWYSQYDKHWSEIGCSRMHTHTDTHLSHLIKTCVAATLFLPTYPQTHATKQLVLMGVFQPAHLLCYYRSPQSLLCLMPLL